MGILGVRSLLWLTKEFALLAIDQIRDHYRKDKQMDKDETEIGTADAHGGDVIFTALREQVSLDPGEGVFSFRLAGCDPEEIMRIDPDGSFFVRGEKAGADIGAYAGFGRWFGRTGDRATAFTTGKGCSDGSFDPKSGTMFFRAGEDENTAREFLRIEPGPTFYVMGEEVSSGLAVFGGFKEWLWAALALLK